MKVYDTYPTNQNVPAGYEKLSDTRDRIGADSLLAELQTGSTIAYEYNDEDVRIEPIEAFEWRSDFSDFMLCHGYKQHYFSPDLPEDPATSREYFSYGQTWRLLLTNSRPTDLPQIEPVTNQGGRPSTWNWEGAMVELARYAILNEDTIPTRAILNKLLQQWFNETTGDEPSASQVREHVRRFHERVWPPRT